MVVVLVPVMAKSVLVVVLVLVVLVLLVLLLHDLIIVLCEDMHFLLYFLLPNTEKLFVGCKEC